MIALMFLLGAALWLVVVIVLTVWIPRILGDGWPRTIARLILFPVLLVLPIADEWIGRRQFKELCEKEAVVKLSPNWRSTKYARVIREPEINLPEYFIPIQSQTIKYLDANSKEVFLEYKIFFTYGGFLMTKIGFGLGLFRSCSPPNKDEVLKSLSDINFLKDGY